LLRRVIISCSVIGLIDVRHRVAARVIIALSVTTLCVSTLSVTTLPVTTLPVTTLLFGRRSTSAGVTTTLPVVPGVSLVGIGCRRLIVASFRFALVGRAT
tara:strand:+ start:429 stop:728 length:300 start_codon:yes stop_codon:yes gene_type:complete